MKVIIGADHGGFELKKQLITYLNSLNIPVEDAGAYSIDPVDDFPDYAKKVATAIAENPDENKGVLICRSGQGMTIAANRVKGVRAALAFAPEHIKAAREDSDVNIVSLAADYTNYAQAVQILDVFLNTPPKTDEKYQRRITKLDL